MSEDSEDLSQSGGFDQFNLFEQGLSSQPRDPNLHFGTHPPSNVRRGLFEDRHSLPVDTRFPMPPLFRNTTTNTTFSSPIVGSPIFTPEQTIPFNRVGADILDAWATSRSYVFPETYSQAFNRPNEINPMLRRSPEPESPPAENMRDDDTDSAQNPFSDRVIRAMEDPDFQGLPIGDQFGAEPRERRRLQQRLRDAGVFERAPQTSFSARLYDPDDLAVLNVTHPAPARTQNGQLSLLLKRTTSHAYPRESTYTNANPKAVRVEIGVVPWRSVKNAFLKHSRAYIRNTVNSGNEITNRVLKRQSVYYPTFGSFARHRHEMTETLMQDYANLTMGEEQTIQDIANGPRKFSISRIKDKQRAWLTTVNNWRFQGANLAELWTMMLKSYLPESGEPNYRRSLWGFEDSSLNTLTNVDFLLEMPIFAFDYRLENNRDANNNVGLLSTGVQQFIQTITPPESMLSRTVNIWCIRVDPIGVFNSLNVAQKEFFDASLTNTMRNSDQSFDYATKFIGVYPEKWKFLKDNFEQKVGREEFLLLPREKLNGDDPIRILEEILSEIIIFYTEQYRGEEGQVSLSGLSFALKLVSVSLFSHTQAIKELIVLNLGQDYRQMALDFMETFTPRAFEFNMPHGLQQFVVNKRNVDSSKAMQRDSEQHIIDHLPCTQQAFLRYLWVLVVKKFGYPTMTLRKLHKLMENTSQYIAQKYPDPRLGRCRNLYQIQKDLSPEEWIAFAVENLKWSNWITYRVGVSENVIEEEPICILFQETHIPDAPTFLMFEILTGEQSLRDKVTINRVFHHVTLLQTGKYEAFKEYVSGFQSLAAFLPGKKDIRKRVAQFKENPHTPQPNGLTQQEIFANPTRRFQQVIQNTYDSYIPTSYQIKRWNPAKSERESAVAVEANKRLRAELKHLHTTIGQTARRQRISEDAAFLLHLPKTPGFIGWDIETFTDFNRLPFCSSIYNADTTEARTFWGEDCIQATLAYFKELLISTKVPVLNIWTLNGSRFDFMYILPYLERASLAGTITNVKKISAQFTYKNEKNQNVIGFLDFLDLGLTLSGSLESLAKSFGVGQKADHSFEHFTDWESVNQHQTSIQKYCEQDAKLVYLIYAKFRFIVNHRLRKTHAEIIPTTFISASSLAFDIWRRFFLKDHALRGCLRHEYNILKESYYGGYTQVLRTKLGRGYYYDINSSYPSVMTEVMPTQKVDCFTDPKNVKLSMNPASRKPYLLYLFKVQKFKFSADVQVPPIPMKVPSGNLYVLENDTKPCWIWDHLYDRIMEWYPGTELEVSEVWVFNSGLIFKNMIDQFYPLKRDTKKAELKVFAKLLMNSVYGKTGQRDFPEKKLMGPFEKGTSGLEILKMVNEELFTYSRDLERVRAPGESKGEERSMNKLIGELRVLDFKDKFSVLVDYPNLEGTPNHPGSLIFIASYVTSKGRLKLFDMIHSCQKAGIGVYYADTDSVFVDAPIPKDIHDTELGKWKLECEVQRAVFLGSKMYAYETVTPDGVSKIIQRCKGIPASDLSKIKLFELEPAGAIAKIAQAWTRVFGSVQGGGVEKRVRPTLNRRVYLTDGSSKPLKNITEFEELN